MRETLCQRVTFRRLTSGLRMDSVCNLEMDVAVWACDVVHKDQWQFINLYTIIPLEVHQRILETGISILMASVITLAEEWSERMRNIIVEHLVELRWSRNKLLFQGVTTPACRRSGSFMLIFHGFWIVCSSLTRKER
ncbi:hypothetical protein VNO78_11324 [Psophocarpus tetragonolobus]|uniref:Uncharacterized protein n=1 Tax=Psophocarpus tetragonolobus TaxID=3891 RepID=A0AAN9SL77_PSOTE